MSKKDAYAIVTDRIIEALDAGIVPWHQPWKTIGGGPTSLSTGKPYRGINVWILSVTAQLCGYTSPYWVTFKQAKERGGSVRKGEKGTQVVLWKPVKREGENERGETENSSYMLLRYFTVFNLDQCDGIEIAPTEPLPEHEPIEHAETLAHGYRARGGPVVNHGGDRACYSPALDYVAMPLVDQFETPEHYYSVLFHELAHSTGHESRLGRKTLIHPAPFGSEDYSQEELVAEMSAAFLCGEAGIPVNVEHHASYLGSWLKKLRDDRKMIVQAAAQAQKAADLVAGKPAYTKEEERTPAPLPRSDHPEARRNHVRPLSLLQEARRIRRRPSRGDVARTRARRASLGARAGRRACVRGMAGR